MDIDGAEFNPENSFYDIIGQHSLEELLTLENNLASEMKALDINMQTLVYENYSKFIVATDTIR